MDAVVRAYQTTSRQVARDDLIVDHLSLVKHVLGRILATLPEGVDRENLEAAGTLGLVEAASQYDPSRNVKFSTFAWKRIYGAVIDELRRNCPLPQSMLERWSRIREVLERLEGTAETSQIAEHLDLTETEIEDCFVAIRLTQPESWKEGFGFAAVADHSERQEQVALIADGLMQLNERDRAILTMYYKDEMYLREIGQALDLSESRVCRLLASAESRLQKIVHAKYNK